MSEILPSSSHQLVAAAIAFHRARRKFSVNPSESSYKDSKCIQLDNRSEDTTRKRNSRYCCGKNCDSVECEFWRKKVNDNVVVSSKMYNPLKKSEETEGNELEDFRDTPNGFEVCEMNNSLAGTKKNCSCYQNMRITRRKCTNDTINQLQRKSKSQCDDSNNDDALLDFPRKLYEWERRSREETLMKMQRLHEFKMKKYKKECKCKSFGENSHCCRVNGNSRMATESIDENFAKSLTSNSTKVLDVRDMGNNGRVINNFGSRKFARKLDAASCSLPEESETDDEVLNARRIKHRDSVDILIDKFKAKRINEEKRIDAIGGFSGEISQRLSSDEIHDNNVLKETANGFEKVDENVETCCTRKNSSKELRSNKLADRLRHKCRRSRLTKSAICYSNEETSYV